MGDKEELKKIGVEYDKFADHIKARIELFNACSQRVKDEKHWEALKDLARSLVKEIHESKFRGMIINYMKKARPRATFKYDRINYEPIEYTKDLSGTIQLLTAIVDDAKLTFGFPEPSNSIYIPFVKVRGKERKIELVGRSEILNALPDC